MYDYYGINILITCRERQQDKCKPVVWEPIHGHSSQLLVSNTLNMYRLYEIRGNDIIGLAVNCALHIKLGLLVTLRLPQTSAQCCHHSSRCFSGLEKPWLENGKRSFLLFYSRIRIKKTTEFPYEKWPEQIYFLPQTICVRVLCHSVLGMKYNINCKYFQYHNPRPPTRNE